MYRASIAASCAVLLAAAAHGQSVNVDFGSTAGGPAAIFAGAGAPGEWNVVATSGTVLVGLDGAPTGIIVEMPDTLSAFDDPATGGQEEALLDDGLSGLGDVLLTVSLTGVRPGRYQLVTYAWTPGNPNDTTLVGPFGDFAEAKISGGPWPGGLEEGVTHVVHDLVVSSGTIHIEYGGGVWGHTGFINGLQLERRCGADVNLDQQVDVDDLVAVLSTWGACNDGCAEDVNGDGQVDVDDLLAVIMAWGPCPGSEQALCLETGGAWDPLSCGHYICGSFPDCDAIIPGCNCGKGRNFVDGVGCVEDEDCK